MGYITQNLESYTHLGSVKIVVDAAQDRQSKSGSLSSSGLRLGNHISWSTRFDVSQRIDFRRQTTWESPASPFLRHLKLTGSATTKAKHAPGF